ncbi:bifunctional aminoglycoside phosphotransferase/ATP-binding protein [Pseudomonas oryzae]|uniref:Aminoglycoside phosphotransferase domain-containing protein n=1 Tax=Pseudomonas oryzae TaxID=1392877 RepID=A0A1H1Z266_9PSED|nr:bifunctional aminoglycoside phosphotransferase/ATP-binding protein [Pseudomonas oryzae]SDT27811.1 hypothetical protein SAMN05216221_4044 [Pseudomonas oryzae]
MPQSLIEALQNPALYPHPVEGFEVIETHISWVLLTGPYAYKLKKPVDFGFLDFSTREAREHFCREELRLNQRTAPDIYLEVLPVTGGADNPQLGGTGPAVDHVLKMRQFPQSGLLSNVLARGELTAAHIDQLAQQIANLHAKAQRVPSEHTLGSAEAIMAPVRQNFEQIRPLLDENDDLAQLQHLEAWAEDTFARLRPVLDQRKADGFVRECHGDIHLANVALLGADVLLFDCIEFNEPFRLIDVMSDAAFLAMDLEDRGLKSLSSRFINAYLELTGDYQGLTLLPFYKAYRAMVRAKICLFRLAQEQDAGERSTILSQYRNYASLAESYSTVPVRFLAITHGVSAVGKSHVAQRLVEAFGAIRLRSDVERKRLLPGADESALYSAAASQATYARLHELGAAVLRAGFPVVLDATYLKHAQRQAAHAVAEQLGVPFLILDCHAPQEVIAAWLAERRAEGRDPSDATLAVVQAQEAGREPLDEEELAHSGRIATHETGSLDDLVERLRRHLPGL